MAQFSVFLVAAPSPLLMLKFPICLTAKTRGQSFPLGLVPPEDDPTPHPVVEGRAHFPAG